MIYGNAVPNNQLKRATVRMVVTTICALAVAGCGPSLPRNAPLVGSPSLAGEQDHPEHGLSVLVPVCNRGSAKLIAKVRVESGASELMPGRLLSEFGAPSGTYCWFTACAVNNKRANPVRLRLTWQRGADNGDFVYTIDPADDAAHQPKPPVSPASDHKRIEKRNHDRD